jgi:hypothetical protein
MSRPFRGFLPKLAPSERCHAEAAVSAVWRELTERFWAEIAVECDTANAIGIDCDPLDIAAGESLDRYMARKRRESYPHSTLARRSQYSGRVDDTMGNDDFLKRVPASQYLPAIAGTEVSPTGTCRCPTRDHPDRNPSAKAYGARVVCFGCGFRGGIYEVGAEVYGLETTGSDFLRLRELIAQALLGVRGDV